MRLSLRLSSRRGDHSRTDLLGTCAASERSSEADIPKPLPQRHGSLKRWKGEGFLMVSLYLLLCFRWLFAISFLCFPAFWMCDAWKVWKEDKATADGVQHMFLFAYCFNEVFKHNLDISWWSCPWSCPRRSTELRGILGLWGLTWRFMAWDEEEWSRDESNESRGREPSKLHTKRMHFPNIKLTLD